MMADIFIKTYNAPEINRMEILRYAGCREKTAEIAELLELCIAEAAKCLTYKVCYGVFDNKGDSGSASLEKNLRGCSRVILFAATLGISLDRLIVKYGKISPSKALMMQAIGAERIESLCDAFCRDMSKEFGAELKPRFSPGYGDLPIELQRDIFRVLDCPRKIGLTLNESMLMSPTKSVTAIVGIEDEY